MPRLIDADHLEIIKFTVTEENEYAIGWNEAIAAIKDNAPTIDPVHAAGGCYCRECEYRTKDTQWTRAGFCGRRDAGPMMIARPDDFCSYGKRREENEV